jgi:hypothetical protein
MAAGLGFKTFAVGEVLSAANVNGYLMQGVLVFANATARDAAITSPQEGQFAYLKDTNVTTYYTGSAWANLDTTGMTNPMTTTGDTIYSSSGSTPARLGIGTSGQVLTVSGGGVPSWTTPAGGGGKVLQVVNATTTTQTTNTTSTYADTTLTATITPTLATSKILILTAQHIYFNGSSASDQAVLYRLMRDATAIATYTDSLAFNFVATGGNLAGIQSLSWLDSPATTSATTYKTQFALNKSGTAYTQLGSYPAAITLLEIGA